MSKLVSTFLWEALKEAVGEVSLLGDVETHEVGVVRLVLLTAHETHFTQTGRPLITDLTRVETAVRAICILHL